ncbi:MAG: LLM class flavin-dependent oxidoreductase [Streptosporangiaceae bacterium]|nr:LLM class flavin-dependent oxidoreductase [Streptosporangiaceae bacterium]MBV9855411.1 LLM class flavin-dependent oxidoreductase [Streptosporangiaceae bacterium]
MGNDRTVGAEVTDTGAGGRTGHERATERIVAHREARADITVGLRVPHELPGGTAGLREFAARAEATGLDRLFVGDHVVFKGGRGFDGLLNAAALAVATQRVTVQTAVYLLPLRHPVPVARQVASLAELAPGRLVFGVGLGGEDLAELRACGVDPATRGRRMEEALAALRPLLAGGEVTVHGAFFRLDRVRMRPAPQPPVPIVIGGRSDAALRRVARHGDGWLGLWVSPARYAEAVGLIGKYAAEAERPVTQWGHGMHVWCGLGPSPGAARDRLGAVMEGFYQVPFGKFERYCPCGTPGDVAASLQPYVDAGCRSFNLIPVADSEQAAIEGAAAVRAALRGRTDD